MRPKKTPVPRIGRILDLAALLVFLAGAGLYARAWLGLRGMDAFDRDPEATTWAAIEHADALSSLGRVGIALMVAGGLLAATAALIARRGLRRSEARAPTQP